MIHPQKHEVQNDEKMTTMNKECKSYSVLTKYSHYIRLSQETQHRQCPLNFWLFDNLR